LLFVEPPTYGRLCAGVSVTATIHGSDANTVATANTAPRFTRPSHERGVPRRTASPIAGSGMAAASIFVLNARPTRTPAPTSHRTHRSSSNYRSTAHAAPTRNRTMNGSGRLIRSVATLIGLTASVAAAAVAAATPKRRRTMHHRSATVAVPAMTLGSSRLHDDMPKIRTLRPWIHTAT